MEGTFARANESVDEVCRGVRGRALPRTTSMRQKRGGEDDGIKGGCRGFYVIAYISREVLSFLSFFRDHLACICRLPIMQSRESVSVFLTN